MSSVLFTNAFVLSCNAQIGDLEKANVLVEGTRITAVGPSLTAEADEVVDATGMVLMPGLIDTHSHLWETPFKGRASDAWGMEYFTNIHPLGAHMSAEDAYAGIYAGLIESLSQGVTTILDYNTCIHTPEYSDAAIDAIRLAGIRGVMGYDLRGKSAEITTSLPPSDGRFADIERIHDALSDDPEDLVRLAICLGEVTPDTMDQVEREISLARSLGCISTWHCNAPGEIEAIAARGLLGSDVLPAHGNYTTDRDLALLGEVGGYLTTQPEAETYAGRRSMSMVARGHRAGVGIALGVDVPVIMNLGLLPQMRLLHFLQRYMDGMIERYEARVPVVRREGTPTLTPRNILNFATLNGAAALGLADHIGQIAPGFQADIVLMDTRDFGMAEGDPAGHVVLNSSGGDIKTVMVAGSFRKRDGTMIDVDMPAMLQAREEARDRVYDRAGEVPGGLHKTYWEWGAST